MTPKPPGTGPEKTKLRILLVEDTAADSELILRHLRRAGFEITGDVVQTAAQFRSRLRSDPPDIVLADYNLGQWRGMEALAILREEKMDIPLILVSGALGDVTAVECIKQGATDYVLKDALTRLPVSIRRALQEKQLREDRRRAEEELAKKVGELAHSNMELEQFAYVASHDLQEPLRMVAAYTQLLAERYHGKLDEQADKYIHYAVDGALRMQALIQDLLAFSRAGRADMDLTSADCNLIVEDAMKNLAVAIRESNAVVNFECLPVVMGNAAQLRQVFQNLIGNAIKFRGSRPPVVQISAEQENGEWLFSVSDNGIGIAPEHLDSIFVVFQRLHTRQEYPGNGIGLSICKKIIERHGGKIWVESHEGHGANFKFTLPLEAHTVREVMILEPGKEHKHEDARSLVGG
ncbi:MAG TPA: ATP-binding protein [Terriglobales bacterium]|nr:ATP-binding protein [Terriglobales bacterium]